MTDRKFLILIILTVGIFFVLSLYLRPSKKPASPAVPAIQQDKAFSKMESQMQQLKDMVNNYGDLNKAFDEEKQKALEVKEKVIDLKQQLKDVAAQKETLLKELSETKAKLELTQPLRQKLAYFESALSGLEFSPDKQNQVIAQLDALVKDLDSIDRKMPDMLEGNRSFKDQVQSLTELLNKKEEELSAVRQQVEDAQAKSLSLSKNLDAVLEQLMAATKGKANLEQKIMDSEKSLLDLKKSSYFLQAKLEKSLKELNNAKTKEAQLTQEKQQAAKETEEYKANIALLNKKNQELMDELNSLKTQLAQLNKDYSSLKDEHEKTQLAVKQNGAEFAKSKEEIAFFKEKLTEADTKLMDVQSKYKEVKKDSAVLREQVVSVQLEREKIRDELDQAKIRLSELQDKFHRIGSMVDSNKKVDVELSPEPQAALKDGK